MDICHGTLVVHEDGSPAYCSDDRRGGCRREHAVEAHRVLQSCRLADGRACPECAGHGLVVAYRPRGLAGIA